MIRNIVFDMGNVLLDFDPYLPCLRHAKDPAKARELCNAIFELPEWGELVDGGVLTEESYTPRVQARLNTDELKALAAAVLRDWHVDGLYPKSGMDAVIEDLLERGYRLYILSNVGYCFHDFKYKIKHLERFSGIMLSSEERIRKPDPELYQRLLQKYGLNAEECLFIDDLPANIEGAQSVGMQGYCYADGSVAKLAEYLKNL